LKLRNSFELILYKAYADLRAEAARSYLGLVWWIIEPIMYLGAFYILFVHILERGDPSFVPNFLCGAVVWKWFDSGLKGGNHAISANLGLLQQVYVPKFIFPIIAVLGSTARFIPVFLMLVLFLLCYGVPAQVTWLAAPVLIFIQFYLIIALAMLAGAVTPFLPDLRVAVDNGMMFLFFLSGVFFNINDVHEPMQSYLLLNPMAGLIDEYRNIMIRGIWPDAKRLSFILLISSIVGGFALLLLKRLDHRYGKVGF
jgi:lipopolysaccharide transport system permease protein